MPTFDPTCRAHFVDTTTSCTGPAVVTVFLDSTTGNVACEHHAAVVLRTCSKSWIAALPETTFETTKRVFTAGRS
jgi:hypothetical protein